MMALVLAVTFGLQDLTTGCVATTFLREGTVPDVHAVAEQAREEDPYQLLLRVHEAAHVRAMADHAKVTFPLSVGRMLLGGLLCVVGFMALPGRRGSRALVMQALAVNIAFTALDYVLSRDMRATWIELFAQAGALLPPELPDRERLVSPEFWWGAHRTRLIMVELGMVLMAAALSTTRARQWFAMVAAASRDEAEGP
ncbi:uncharacterized protein CMC5_004440 [Chondromyces crocatus]|uniref:Uncharacterized protein n=2 Tax=Chondromyces crocatus TaxID=52 RepID=A0A0K1E629_CHOCO|nr:uncharacterized protein CMC5_004440 [Chondromyces crocatus]